MMLRKPEEGDELSMANMAVKCNLEMHNEPRKSVSYLSDVKAFFLESECFAFMSGNPWEKSKIFFELAILSGKSASAPNIAFTQRLNNVGKINCQQLF